MRIWNVGTPEQMIRTPFPGFLAFASTQIGV